MQLTLGMESQPTGDQTTPAALPFHQVRAVPINVAAQEPKQGVASTSTTQADVQVTLPSNPQCILSIQQPEVAAQHLLVHAWPTHPMNGVGVGTGPGALQRQSFIAGQR